ncbi:MAG: hypothetical protein JWQ43_2244 [Glaciihabitans sp.]|nr:hypothetical protein [Glaciihabitans sp.]
MSDRIPEFPVRVKPAGQSRVPANPFLVALTLVWVLALVVAAVCLVIVLQTRDTEGAAMVFDNTVPLAIAQRALVVAFVAGIVHIAVKAILWRSPEY